jgi:hypothetical protein
MKTNKLSTVEANKLYTKKAKLRRNTDPEYREWYNSLRRAQHQKKMQDPEYREKISQKARTYHQEKMTDPEYREKMRQKAKRYRNNQALK